MKNILVLTCTIALVYPIALTGCNIGAEQKAELEQLKVALEKTESERDDLKARIDIVTKTRDTLQEQFAELVGSRDQLKEQVGQITTSRDTLQKQVEDLTHSRDTLQKQVEDLTHSRDSAIVKANNAQERIDKLETKLQIETLKVRQLDIQLKQIQKAIAELQNKLNL